MSKIEREWHRRLKEEAKNPEIRERFIRNMVWFEKNYEGLKRRYSGMVVGVVNRRVKYAGGWKDVLGNVREDITRQNYSGLEVFVALIDNPDMTYNIAS